MSIRRIRRRVVLLSRSLLFRPATATAGALADSRWASMLADSRAARAQQTPKKPAPQPSLAEEEIRRTSRLLKLALDGAVAAFDANEMPPQAVARSASGGLNRSGVDAAKSRNERT